MEPIISPWVFYFISVLDNVRLTTVILFAVGSGIGFAMLLYCIIELNTEERIKFVKTKSFRHYLITVVVCILFLIVTPSKETIYQILIAQHITPDNLVFFKGEAVDLVDYIVGQIKSLKS